MLILYVSGPEIFSRRIFLINNVQRISPNILNYKKKKIQNFFFIYYHIYWTVKNYKEHKEHAWNSQVYYIFLSWRDMCYGLVWISSCILCSSVVTARRRAPLISSGDRCRVLIAVTDENVFRRNIANNKYVKFIKMPFIYRIEPTYSGHDTIILTRNYHTTYTLLMFFNYD